MGLLKLIETVLMATLTTGKEISPQGMTLLKWTDSSGQSQELRLEHQMSSKWTEIGQLLGIGWEELGIWEGSCNHNSIECLRQVIRTWMQRNSEKVRDLE